MCISNSHDALHRRVLPPEAILVLWALGNAQRLVDACSDDEIAGILGSEKDWMARALDTAQGRRALALVWRYILEIIDIPSDRLSALLEVELEPRVFEAFVAAVEEVRRIRDG